MWNSRKFKLQTFSLLIRVITLINELYHMKKYKNHNPRFIKIILTISLNFNSVISKNNILNNILKYVSKNDNNFLFLFSCSVQYLLLLPRKISLMILLSI